MTTSKKATASILSAATIIAVSSIASKILGMLRDRMLVSEFKTAELDVYYSAFRIPDFLYNIIIGGVISAAFVPIFTEFIVKRQIKKAWETTNALINLLLVFLIAACTIMYIAAPWLISVLTHGFAPEKTELTISLTRIMLIAPVLFAVSNILSGILNSFKKFIVYSLAPIMYNAGIIFGTVVLGPSLGVKGIAYGVVIGAALHMLVQIPSVWNVGFRYQRILHVGKELTTMLKMMSFRIIGLSASQIDDFISITVASALPAGSISIFNLATNLQSLPVSIFGISFAIAAFPLLSEYASRKSDEAFINTFSRTFRRIMFLIIPASVAMLLLRAQIVRVFLGTGKFEWEDTIHTARSLGIFVLSLFAQSLVPLFARAFYALKDTKTPVLITIASVTADIAGIYFFSKLYGIEGIAIAFTISNILNLLLLVFFLHRRLTYLDDEKLLQSMFKTTIAALVMGVYIYGTLYAVAPLVNMRTFIGIATQGFAATLVGIVAFFATSQILHNDELELINKLRKLKLKVLRNQPPLMTTPSQGAEEQSEESV